MHCNQCNKPPRNSTYTALYYLHSIVAAYMSFKNCTDKALISSKNTPAVTRNGSKVIKHFYQAGFNFLSNILYILYILTLIQAVDLVISNCKHYIHISSNSLAI